MRAAHPAAHPTAHAHGGGGKGRAGAEAAEGGGARPSPAAGGKEGGQEGGKERRPEKKARTWPMDKPAMAISIFLAQRKQELPRPPLHLPCISPISRSSWSSACKSTP